MSSGVRKSGASGMRVEHRVVVQPMRIVLSLSLSLSWIVGSGLGLTIELGLAEEGWGRARMLAMGLR